MFCFVCFVLVDPFCAARARRNPFAVQRDGEREAAAANSEAAREGSAMAAVEALLCSSPVATEVDPTFVARSEATDCRSERCCADVHVGAHEAVAARSKAARDDGAMAALEALPLCSPPGRPWRPSSGSAVDPRLSPPPMSSLSHFREYAADHAVAPPPAALSGGVDLAPTAAQPRQQQQPEAEGAERVAVGHPRVVVLNPMLHATLQRCVRLADAEGARIGVGRGAVHGARCRRELGGVSFPFKLKKATTDDA